MRQYGFIFMVILMVASLYIFVKVAIYLLDILHRFLHR